MYLKRNETIPMDNICGNRRAIMESENRAGISFFKPVRVRQEAEQIPGKLFK